MADITSGSTVQEQSPRLENKVLFIETEATADSGDTIAVTLADHGATGIGGILGMSHATEDSIVVQEQPTTAVSAGVLAITLTGATNQKRSITVWLN